MKPYSLVREGVRLGYKILHRFAMPDGTETEPLETEEFLEKYEDKLANWDNLDLFKIDLIKMAAEMNGLEVEVKVADVAQVS